MGPMFWPLRAVEQCPNLRKADILFGLTSYSKSFRREVFRCILRTRRMKPALTLDASACVDPNHYWKSSWSVDGDGENRDGQDEAVTTNNPPSANAEKNSTPNEPFKVGKKKSKRKVRIPQYPAWVGMDPNDWKSCWYSDDDNAKPVGEDEAGAEDKAEITNYNNNNEENSMLTKQYIDVHDSLATPAACISPEKRSPCSYAQNNILNHQNDAGTPTEENSIKKRDSGLTKCHKKKSKRKVQRTPDYPTWIDMNPSTWASHW